MGFAMVRKMMMTYRIGLLMMAAAILAGCSGGQESSSASQQEPAVAIRTQPVQQADFPVALRIGGNLRGDQQTMIPAKVATTVTKIPARVGQAVRKGDLLIMLDPGGVQSQYRQAEAVSLNAERQATKMRALFEAGAISETQLDAVETQYEVAKANFNAARQGIEIQAPFAGVVTDIYVRAGDEVAPGMPLVEVADVNRLRLLLEVSTTQLGQLKVGQMVRVQSPIDTTSIMTGSISSIADAASQSTRSFEVECLFASSQKGFAPGMYLMAEIETATLPNAMIVPNTAVFYRSGEALVYCVEADTVKLVTVMVLAASPAGTAVTGDLQPGQRVVVVGQKNLTPGTRVTEATL
jgi:membrane fusion protein (multidrug efflux system)